MHPKSGWYQPPDTPRYAMVRDTGQSASEAARMAVGNAPGVWDVRVGRITKIENVEL